MTKKQIKELFGLLMKKEEDQIQKAIMEAAKIFHLVAKQIIKTQVLDRGKNYLQTRR